jgi:hypothetical protein
MMSQKDFGYLDFGSFQGGDEHSLEAVLDTVGSMLRVRPAASHDVMRRGDNKMTLFSSKA